MERQWPAIGFETLPWESDPDALPFIPKNQRRKMPSTYEAAVPLLIADRDVELPAALTERASGLLMSLARFDAEQRMRGYDLPAMLLRSESSASSQIESLTSSARNVALAELAPDAPHNAQLIAGNIAAMKSALSLEGPLEVAGILEIHRTLINRDGVTFGGALRSEQVWVGGSSFSPHGALYVPPRYERVAAYLDDWSPLRPGMTSLPSPKRRSSMPSSRRFTRSWMATAGRAALFFTRFCETKAC